MCRARHTTELTSGRAPRPRSDSLRRFSARGARHRLGGPCRAGQCGFRHRQMLRSKSASTAAAWLVRLQLRHHRRHGEHDVDVLGTGRRAWDGHRQRRRMQAQLRGGDPAVQSDRRARVECFSANEFRVPAGRPVLLRLDDRLSPGCSAVDSAGHDLVSRNRFRHRGRHAGGSLLRTDANLRAHQQFGQQVAGHLPAEVERRLLRLRSLVVSGFWATSVIGGV
jgi:hypothetical protein